MEDSGKVSEWNEGNLKSLRLHEAQELINITKVEPLKNLSNDKWNYDNWIAGISILFYEGCSKYSSIEIEEVEKIKQLIELRRESIPIHKVINSSDFSGTRNKIIFNNANWKVLKTLIELYERKVKYFNDKHGLSTRNYDEDLEGL